ncbi:MAG TPA: hypothetical protein VF526_12440 [Solirubrobacteraceae bacterium]
MASPLNVGLAVLGAFMAFTAPDAHAATTVGFAQGTGTDAGEAISVKADSRANDITITLARVPVKSGSDSKYTSVRIVDRRGRVRTDVQGRRIGCRERGRRTVVCSGFAKPYAYVFLGGGNDRLTVKAQRDVASAPSREGAAPDGLAGIPSDEGEGGSFLGWHIEGGAGRDRIAGSPFFDDIIGGPGSDVLYGRGGNDLFIQNGESGSDTIFGGAGHDTLAWGSRSPLSIDLGNGTFNGGRVQSIDKVRGGEGNDVLIGSDRPELLQGAGGADAIAGRGGADLLIGDGSFVVPVASDLIDAGAGDDLIDLSNESFDPAGLFGPASGPAPPDTVRCQDGNDRVDTIATQLIPADCEGARFDDSDTTVALRPSRLPDGALVFELPCPGRDAIGRLIAACKGTLALKRFADNTALGAAQFFVRGATDSPVVVSPSSPVAAAEAVSVEISGTFDDPTHHNGALNDPNAFAFGWATTF